MSSTLRGSNQRLTQTHDVALLDLDGVVYIGADAVPGAPAALAQARRDGVSLAFVTNNAARPPSVVAQHLSDLGIEASPEEVITSAQAAARYLAEHLSPGATVLVLGTTGLHEALAERGLVATSKAGESVVAVVQGYSPEMNWSLLAEGAVAINAGALWVATNVDPTVPSPRGPLPGNGSLVAALRHATGAEPVVTGKPDPAMHRETLIRTGATSPIVVGDRLDTDIEGAVAVGCPSLLVLSGVTGARELLAAKPGLRPTFLAADVSGLLVSHPQPEVTTQGATCGTWAVIATDDGWELARTNAEAGHGDQSRGNGSSPSPDLDALRALCAAHWEHGLSEAARIRVTAADDRADVVLAELGLND
ncbi:MAG: HAD-IIA family hydrolase [Jatrophihabitans sp.]